MYAAEPCCPILHHGKLAPLYLDSLVSGHRLKNAYAPHADLTVVTAHDHRGVTLFERSLQYLGLETDVVLRPAPGRKWRNTLKIELLLEWLSSTQCQTELLLFCDAFDVVLTGPLEDIITSFRAYECDLLFMSTQFTGGYACMPERKRWADRLSRGRYLNSGVFVCRPDFLVTVLQRALTFIDAEPMDKAEYTALGKAIADTRVCDRLPDFPRGLFSDQVIFRYIEPEFHPRMRVDYENRLAFRNGDETYLSAELSTLLEYHRRSAR